MLIFVKGAICEIPVTLTELTTSENPNFRFVFTHDTLEKVYEITLEDQSTHPDRYNLFSFTEGNELTFADLGQYEYRAYDSNDVEVEVGKMTLITAAEREEYYFVPDDNEKYAFS